MSTAWQGNWKKRILARLQVQGFAALTDYLRQHPAMSYLEVADRLGKDDVAAFHVEWLHFEEAIKHKQFREAAIDSLMRDISQHLPKGWKEEAKGDFDTSGVWADWIGRLEDYSTNIRPIASAVWDALVDCRPPAGWKPQSTEDGRIARAFDVGWSLITHVDTQLVPRPNSR